MGETPVPSAPARRSWRTWAAGFIILLSGIVIGAGIGFRAARMRDSLTFLDPHNVPARVARIMKFQLGLNEEQREKLEAIFTRRGDEIDRIRLKILPEMDSVFEDLRQEVNGVLTPAQAKAWDEKFRELRERWRPRPQS